VYYGEATGPVSAVETTVYDRYALRPGMLLQGPAIVEERESTVVVALGMHASVDVYQNLVVYLS
jgi:N-methylhydantoinase A